MDLVTQHDIDRYLHTDLTLKRLTDIATPEDDCLVCQEWLRGSAPKRYIYHRLYGDLIDTRAKPVRIVDVGGGLTSFTRVLADRHDYALVELLAHDGREAARQMTEHVGRDFLHNGDWAEFDFCQSDLVIANDIFPNVDQRLELFLEKTLPVTARVRLSLTYYDAHRAYTTRRVDRDEILIMLAWNGRQVRSVLERYATHIISPDMSVFERQNPSVYPNGRQVVLVELRGALDESSGIVSDGDATDQRMFD